MSGKIEVEYISHMGDDAEVCADARVSHAADRGSELRPGLIRYLHKDPTRPHWSPASHQFVKFRIAAPLAVGRQLWKSHVGLCGGDEGYPAWNEVSLRYVSDEPAFYLPDEIRSRPDANIKQGSGGPHPRGAEMRDYMAYAYGECERIYNLMIAKGVAPEQARFVLPMGTMTAWRWTGSLAAWGRVALLRQDGHAQRETQEVAGMIADHCRRLFPLTWAAMMGEAE